MRVLFEVAAGDEDGAVVSELEDLLLAVEFFAVVDHEPILLHLLVGACVPPDVEVLAALGQHPPLQRRVVRIAQCPRGFVSHFKF